MSELECPCSICPPCRSAYSSQVTFYHTFPLLFFIKLTVPSECLFLQASARCGIRMSTPREQGLRLTYSRTAFSPVTGKCLAHIFTSARNMCGIGAQRRGLPSAPQETAHAAGRIAVPTAARSALVSGLCFLPRLRPRVLFLFTALQVSLVFFPSSSRLSPRPLRLPPPPLHPAFPVVFCRT